MMKSKLLAALIAAGVLMGGCAMVQMPCDEESAKEYPVAFVDLQKIANEAASSLTKGLPPSLQEPIVVSDFVDIGSLRTDSLFGFVLANYLKDALVKKRRFRVIEVGVSQLFHIGPAGLRLLSRDADKLLHTKLPLRWAIVGSYAVAKKSVSIFVKLIDLRNGTIEASYTKEIPLTCKIASMLKKRR